MLTMVTVDNLQSGTLLLPLMDSSGGYSVKDIQGLDPVKASLISSKLAQMDGAQHQHSRREPRNILMKLGFEPDYVTSTVDSLRSNLYQYLMPKDVVTFALYKDDILFGTTEAYVESCENNMFTADPEIDISLICYDPDFYAPAETELANWSTTSGISTHTIDYNGTSDTGVIFSLTFPEPATEIRLYNTRPDQVLDVLILTGEFLVNDVLTVNTNPGKKAVTVTRAGLPIPSLYFLDRTSSWISLKKGNNLFRAHYSGTVIPYTLKYTARYGGF
jgi:Phage tail protein